MPNDSEREKIARILDNQLIKVFNPLTVEYVGGHITGKSAEDLAEIILPQQPVEEKLPESITIEVETRDDSTMLISPLKIDGIKEEIQCLGIYLRGNTRFWIVKKSAQEEKKEIEELCIYNAVQPKDKLIMGKINELIQAINELRGKRNANNKTK